MRKTIALSMMFYAIVFLLLFSQLVMRSEYEWDRATVVVIASAVTVIAWFSMRKRFPTRLGLTLFTLPLLELGMGCLWSAVNFVRYRTYDCAIDTPNSCQDVFGMAIDIQTIIQWISCIVAVVFVVIAIVSIFRSVSSRSTSSTSANS